MIDALSELENKYLPYTIESRWGRSINDPQKELEAKKEIIALTKRISREIRDLYQQATDNYRDMAHEREAWAKGEAVKKAISKSQQP